MVCCPPAKLALAVVVLIVPFVATAGSEKLIVEPTLRGIAFRFSVVPAPPLSSAVAPDEPMFSVVEATVCDEVMLGIAAAVTSLAIVAGFAPVVAALRVNPLAVTLTMYAPAGNVLLLAETSCPGA